MSAAFCPESLEARQRCIVMSVAHRIESMDDSPPSCGSALSDAVNTPMVDWLLSDRSVDKGAYVNLSSPDPHMSSAVSLSEAGSQVCTASNHKRKLSIHTPSSSIGQQAATRNTISNEASISSIVQTPNPRFPEQLEPLSPTDSQLSVKSAINRPGSLQ